MVVSNLQKLRKKKRYSFLNFIFNFLGIPGLDSIKSFDPFYLNRIKITQGNSQAINLKVELSNVKIIGFGHTHVLESL